MEVEDEAVQVKFELFNQVEEDYHTLKNFISQSLEDAGTSINAGELADLVIDQFNGSVIKVEGENEGEPKNIKNSVLIRYFVCSFWIHEHN